MLFAPALDLLPIATKGHVCFALESRRVQCNGSCQLRVISGLAVETLRCPLSALVQ